MLSFVKSSAKPKLSATIVWASSCLCSSTSSSSCKSITASVCVAAEKKAAGGDSVFSDEGCPGWCTGFSLYLDLSFSQVCKGRIHVLMAEGTTKTTRTCKASDIKSDNVMSPNLSSILNYAVCLSQSWSIYGNLKEDIQHVIL